MGSVGWNTRVVRSPRICTFALTERTQQGGIKQPVLDIVLSNLAGLALKDLQTGPELRGIEVIVIKPFACSTAHSLEPVGHLLHHIDGRFGQPC